MAILTKDTDISPPLPLPSNLLNASQSISNLSHQDQSQIQWMEVSKACKTIADNLTNHELRTSLGVRDVIPSIGQLMERIITVQIRGQGGNDRDGNQLLVESMRELCRVVGNMCFDHDSNRQQTLDANIPNSISKLISLTTTTKSREEEGEGGKRRLLTIEELKFARAAVGALLNSSLKFDPIRRVIASNSEILSSLLSLIDNRPSNNSTTSCQPVYIVGMWSQVYSTEQRGEIDQEELEERLELGETIARWTLNVVEDVLAEDNTHFPFSNGGIPILSSIILSSPIIPSTPSSTSSFFSETNTLTTKTTLSLEDSTSYIDTDIELMSISATLIEGLTLDHSDSKIEISTSRYDTALSNSTLLNHFFDFIEFGELPRIWKDGTSNDAEEVKRVEKAFETIKASIVKTVVEGPNEDRVMDELWRLGGEMKEKNWVVERLVGWLKRETMRGGEEGEGEGEREDLVICASHFLAGMGRKDEYTERLVQDYDLSTPLARIIERRVPLASANSAVSEQRSQPSTTSKSRPGETTQVLYGVVSLMRHLAIPLKNRSKIGSTGIVRSVSKLLKKELDIVQPLQMSVVGLLKHLTSLNVQVSLEILATDDNSTSTDSTSTSTSPLSLILDLIARTDEVRLRCESTRIVVNLVRSLFSTIKSTSTSTSPTTNSISTSYENEDNNETVQPSEEEELRKKGREILMDRKQEVIRALSELVRTSEKFPILINEGIVALTLIAGNGKEGASSVLSEITSSLSSPNESNPNKSETTEEEEEEETGIISRPQQPQQPAQTNSPADTSAVGDPPRSIDMLLNWIVNISQQQQSPSSTTNQGDSRMVRPEMFSNGCTLLMTLIENVNPTTTTTTKETREGIERLKVELVEPVRRAIESMEEERGETMTGSTTTTTTTTMGGREGMLLSLKRLEEMLRRR